MGYCKTQIKGVNMEETITLNEGSEENPILEITRELPKTKDMPKGIPTKVTERISLQGLKNRHKTICDRMEALQKVEKEVAAQIEDAEKLVADATIAKAKEVIDGQA